MRTKMIVKVVGHYQDTIYLVIEPPKKTKEK